MPDQDSPDPYTSDRYNTDEFVTVFASRSHSAEVEADAIHGLLESAGLQSLIVRENVPTVPVGKVSIKVLTSDKEDAETLIEDAREAGRTAAAGEAPE